MGHSHLHLACPRLNVSPIQGGSYNALFSYAILLIPPSVSLFVHSFILLSGRPSLHAFVPSLVLSYVLPEVTYSYFPSF